MAHIGEPIAIKGELSGSEDVYLDGELEGRVELLDGSLRLPMVRSCNSSVLFWQKQRGRRPVRLGDDPQPVPGVCPVAAEQSKPMSHAVFILCDIGWLQFAPVPDCVTAQEAGWRLLRSLQGS